MVTVRTDLCQAEKPIGIGLTARPGPASGSES